MELNCIEIVVDTQGKIVNKKCGLRIAFGEPATEETEDTFSSIYVLIKNAVTV